MNKKMNWKKIKLLKYLKMKILNIFLDMIEIKLNGHYLAAVCQTERTEKQQAGRPAQTSVVKMTRKRGAFGEENSTGLPDSGE